MRRRWEGAGEARKGVRKRGDLRRAERRLVRAFVREGSVEVEGVVVGGRRVKIALERGVVGVWVQWEALSFGQWFSREARAEGLFWKVEARVREARRAWWRVVVSVAWVGEVERQRSAWRVS